MTRPLKIAFVNQPLNQLRIPLKADSVGIWTYEVARRFSEHEVRIYARAARPWRGESRRHEGVDLVRIPFGVDQKLQALVGGVRRLVGPLGLLRNPRKPSFASGLFGLAFALRTALDVRRWGGDLVHIHNFSQFAPLIRLFNPRAKIVLHMHCEWLSQLDARTVARRLRAVDLVLGCSEHVVRQVRSRFPQYASRCFSLRNGVDIERFSPCEAKRAAGDRQEEPLILFVGRVSPEKGVHVLLRAFAEVVSSRPSARLHIVGPQRPARPDFVVDLSDDPLVKGLSDLYHPGYRAMLEQQLDPGVAARVSFIRTLPSAEIIEQYRMADILVFPSVWNEPFGMPIVEAMACGTPVVTTRGGGITEIVQDGSTGILVDRGDSAGLAAAILSLLDDPRRAGEMGRRGRACAAERYSWERVADELKHRIAGLADRKTRTGQDLEPRADPTAHGR